MSIGGKGGGCSSLHRVVHGKATAYLRRDARKKRRVRHVEISGSFLERNLLYQREVVARFIAPLPPLRRCDECGAILGAYRQHQWTIGDGLWGELAPVPEKANVLHR
eukprot:scaffold62909_cov39-Tisochrysis_lutea.AAC.1